MAKKRTNLKTVIIGGEIKRQRTPINRGLDETRHCIASIAMEAADLVGSEEVYTLLLDETVPDKLVLEALTLIVNTEGHREIA